MSNVFAQSARAMARYELKIHWNGRKARNVDGVSLYGSAESVLLFVASTLVRHPKAAFRVYGPANPSDDERLVLQRGMSALGLNAKVSFVLRASFLEPTLHISRREIRLDRAPRAAEAGQ